MTPLVVRYVMPSRRLHEFKGYQRYVTLAKHRHRLDYNVGLEHRRDRSRGVRADPVKQRVSERLSVRPRPAISS